MTQLAEKSHNKLTSSPLHKLQHVFDEAFNIIGNLTFNVIDSVKFVAKGQINWRHVLDHTASIGFDSLPMSLLICLIAGCVLAMQTAEQFALSGADDYVGGLVALAIVREMGPIFACLTVGARSGTAIAAEIANMQVTEQVSALKVMQVSPVRYLMVPRFIACMIALPLLTLIGEVGGILGGMVVANKVSNLHTAKYMDSVWMYLTRHDIMVSMVKAAIFGFILASISCTIGLLTKGGAKDVGESTTKAVVWIAVTIIIADFFLTWIFFGTEWS